MITEQDIMEAKDGLNGMTVVQLFPNPKRYDGDRGIVTKLNAAYDWCTRNISLRGNKWINDGVTIWSYRIIFVDEADAVMFMLAHGV
jgi:hypothetical protein